MADINVENFYRDVGSIFTTLYASFPSKAAIYVDEVSGVDEPDEYGMHNPRYTAGFFAMLWLAEEGYMRYAEVIRQDGVDQATLTEKGFLILSEPVASIYEMPAEPADPGATDPGPDDPVLKNLGSQQEERVEEEPDLSPSILEDRMLVINQLRAALRSGSSIAIAKVVQFVLR